MILHLVTVMRRGKLCKFVCTIVHAPTCVVSIACYGRYHSEYKGHIDTSPSYIESSEVERVSFRELLPSCLIHSFFVSVKKNPAKRARAKSATTAKATGNKAPVPPPPGVCVCVCVCVRACVCVSVYGVQM